MMAAFVIFATVLGLLLGSFLNALAYRLPRKESLMTRSHCPKCGKKIHAWENVPVFSWLFLRGKCSGCKAPISIQYPLIELGTAVTFGALTLKAAAITKPTALALNGFLWLELMLLSFAFVGILVTLIDLDIRKIPGAIVNWGLGFAVVSAAGFFFTEGQPERLIAASISLLVFGAVYFALWFFKPGQLGYGDVRFSLLAGFILGWISPGAAVIGFFLPWFLAFIAVIPGLIRKKMNGKTAIPFGPWLVLGTVLAILFGDILANLYTQLGSI